MRHRRIAAAGCRNAGSTARRGESVSGDAQFLYYLSDATLKITYPDGKTAERTVKANTAVWSEAVTHAAENIGNTELHEVQTELKETAKKSKPAKKTEKSPT